MNESDRNAIAEGLGEQADVERTADQACIENDVNECRDDRYFAEYEAEQDPHCPPPWSAGYWDYLKDKLGWAK